MDNSREDLGRRCVPSRALKQLVWSLVPQRAIAWIVRMPSVPAEPLAVCVEQCLNVWVGWCLSLPAQGSRSFLRSLHVGSVHLVSLKPFPGCFQTSFTSLLVTQLIYRGTLEVLLQTWQTTYMGVSPGHCESHTEYHTVTGSWCVEGK